jgi:hypothetical protein
MEKLEQYLDQVCRSIGGPRSLRQHVRQELREHLLDAVSQHKAAGMSEEKALERALEDFGGPEQVRSELEATHGHRLMPVVIDKAMQWKEKTMQAKWLWMTWAHLVLAGTVAAEVLFITFAVVFIAPRFEMFIREGWIGIDRSEPLIAWVPGFFRFLGWVANSTTWLFLGAVLLWGIFEWRVRGENKTFMRLSALGTTALMLMVMVMLTGAALVLPVGVGVRALHERAPEPVVSNQLSSIDAALSATDEALAKKDWEALREQLNQASRAIYNLKQMGVSAPTLVSMREQPKVEETRAHLDLASDSLRVAQDAIADKNAPKLEAAMKKFREAYGQVKQ